LHERLHHTLTQVEVFTGNSANPAWKSLSEQLRLIVRQAIPSSSTAEASVERSLERIENNGFYLSDADFKSERMDLCKSIREQYSISAGGTDGSNQAGVFLVHGRDKHRAKVVKDLLRCVKIEPLNWEDIVRDLNTASPSVWEVVLSGIYRAQSVVVLLTPDEKVALEKDLASTPSELEEALQPRPNVLIELGIALAERRASTIVVQYPNVREISDVQSINFVSVHGKVSDIKNFLVRLETVGHVVDWKTDWQNYLLE